MLKSLISSVLVVAVVFISILNVGAVNEPTAPTEYITEVVTDVATEATTETYTEVSTELVTDVISYVHFYEVLCFILFGISFLLGVELARAFSFWKW